MRPLKDARRFYRRFRRWSLPGKCSFVGVIIGVLSLALYFYTPKSDDTAHASFAPYFSEQLDYVARKLEGLTETSSALRDLNRKIDSLQSQIALSKNYQDKYKHLLLAIQDETKAGIYGEEFEQSLNSGLIELVNENFKGAITHFQYALQFAVDNGSREDAYFALGATGFMDLNRKFYSQAGFLDEREIKPYLSYLDSAMELHSDPAFIWILKGYLYDLTYNPSVSLTYYQKSIAYDSTNYLGWEALSNSLLLLDRTDEALTALEKAIQFPECSYLVWGWYAKTLNNLGDYAAAKNSADKSIMLNRANDEAWRERARAFDMMGDNERALMDVKQAVAIDSMNYYNWYCLGIVLDDSRYDDAALAAFRKAADLNPDIPEVWFALGNYHQERGDIETSASLFDTALSKDRTYSPAWNNLGKYYMVGGDLIQATVCYDSALFYDSNHVNALANRALLFAGKGEFKAAGKLADRSYELGNRLCNFRILRALIRAANGDKGEDVYGIPSIYDDCENEQFAATYLLFVIKYNLPNKIWIENGALRFQTDNDSLRVLLNKDPEISRFLKK